jgi:MFS family permease
MNNRQGGSTQTEQQSDIEKIDDHSSNQDTDLSSEFKLERYKYILQEIRSLNENLHKYLTWFQTLATALIGGGVALFVSWQSLKISSAVARVGLRGLVGLLIILAMFVIISIIAGIFSWFDYRKEEVELLKQAVKPEFRKPPTIWNFWRWQETYLILFIIVAVIVICIYIESQIIPLIQ